MSRKEAPIYRLPTKGQDPFPGSPCLCGFSAAIRPCGAGSAYVNQILAKSCHSEDGQKILNGSSAATTGAAPISPRLRGALIKAVNDPGSQRETAGNDGDHRIHNNCRSAEIVSKAGRAGPTTGQSHGRDLYLPQLRPISAPMLASILVNEALTGQPDPDQRRRKRRREGRTDRPR